MTKEKVESFEKLHGQIESLHEEIGVFSKKSPNDALNKFKLKLINNLLSQANVLIEGNYKPIDGFDLFNEDDIPTNSDVTLVLGQYLKCLDTWRSDNICQEKGRWYWKVDGSPSAIRTASPNKLRE